MIRKFNYTGRKKLSQKRIDISIVDDRPFKSFIASIDLKGLRLSANAKVYVEPYYKSSFMRFDFGTVDNLQAPASTALFDIPRTSIIQFRVKVVDETAENGRIVRLADKIKAKNTAENSGNRLAIMHIDWEKDLDQQIFRVAFPDNDYPRLEINRRIENAKELVKNDQVFRALVFPVAIRQIAEKIANTRGEFDEDDSSWQSTWMKFIKKILHVNIDLDFDETDDDEITYWVEEVVASFCRKNKVRKSFEQTINRSK